MVDASDHLTFSFDKVQTATACWGLYIQHNADWRFGRKTSPLKTGRDKVLHHFLTSQHIRGHDNATFRTLILHTVAKLTIMKTLILGWVRLVPGGDTTSPLSGLALHFIRFTLALHTAIVSDSHVVMWRVETPYPMSCCKKLTDLNGSLYLYAFCDLLNSDRKKPVHYLGPPAFTASICKGHWNPIYFWRLL